MSTAAAADWRAVRSASLLISFMMTRWADLSSAEVIGSVQSYVRVRCTITVSMYVLVAVFHFSSSFLYVTPTRKATHSYDVGSAESSPARSSRYLQTYHLQCDDYG